MSSRALVDVFSQPRLAAHRRLRFDEARQSWTIQAPERVFLLDSTAHAIVAHCDGARTIAAIVDELCASYPGAPRETISADVMTLVQDFTDKGVMSL